MLVFNFPLSLARADIASSNIAISLNELGPRAMQKSWGPVGGSRPPTPPPTLRSETQVWKNRLARMSLFQGSVAIVSVLKLFQVRGNLL